MKFLVFFQIVNETYETHETLKIFFKKYWFFCLYWWLFRIFS